MLPLLFQLFASVSLHVPYLNQSTQNLSRRISRLTTQLSSSYPYRLSKIHILNYPATLTQPIILQFIQKAKLNKKSLLSYSYSLYSDTLSIFDFFCFLLFLARMPVYLFNPRMPIYSFSPVCLCTLSLPYVYLLFLSRSAIYSFFSVLLSTLSLPIAYPLFLSRFLSTLSLPFSIYSFSPECPPTLSLPYTYLPFLPHMPINSIYLPLFQPRSPFYSSLGHKCPATFNPADFYIHTLAVQPGHELRSRERIKRICDNFAVSAYAKDIDISIQYQDNMSLQFTDRGVRMRYVFFFFLQGVAGGHT